MRYKKIILILSTLIIILGIAKSILLILPKTINKNIIYKDKIILYNFTENQEITSPLIIKGRARGTWFFEASFPIILTNWDGLIIAQGYATAQDDWMTEDFIDFIAELEFEKPNIYNRGSLILKKDNPSGLPEHDDALEIPITFK